MSPWELLAIYILLPVLVVGLWLNNRYDTDGANVPEFELWCRRERPVLFAFRGSPQCVSGIVSKLQDAIGPKRQVVHHSGRFPWTRYLFTLAIEHDVTTHVVRCRVERAVIRRLRDKRPEISALAHQLIRDSSEELRAVWLHTELRDGDEARGEDRRSRGWLATRERNSLSAFEPTGEAPDWARAPEPAP